MIGEEGVADEVDLAEVGAHPVGKKGGPIALELVEGGDPFASETDERANAEDDEGRIHGDASRSSPCRPTMLALAADVNPIVLLLRGRAAVLSAIFFANP